ncbi:MAG: LutC/YkgG family protein [Rhodospirillales bacterium]
MRSRELMLADIRRALGRSGPVDAPTRAALEARMKGRKPNLVPQRGQVRGREAVEAFVKMAEVSLATVRRVRADADVPQAVAEYLKSQNLSPRLRMAPDRRLDAVPWSDAPLLQIARGKADPADEVGLTGVFAGIAETGTLMLLSGPESPSTLNFLPETHVAVVKASEILGSYEEGWAKLRQAGAGLPRTVNFITGPSRSGDIEQTLQLGAHGPRRLHIVLVDDGGQAGGRG